jgi:hypothetical protein
MERGDDDIACVGGTGAWSHESIVIDVRDSEAGMKIVEIDALN